MNKSRPASVRQSEERRAAEGREAALLLMKEEMLVERGRLLRDNELMK
jgi:hypothetical protein